MGISQSGFYKRRKTGGKQKTWRKKRKFELGRPAAMTKLGPKKVHFVRTRGGNEKRRALKLDHGNFAWGSERCTRKSKIIDVVYNASNNELVRTKILVKNTIVVIDATPFRLWYENYYRMPLPVKQTGKEETADETAAKPAEQPAAPVAEKKKVEKKVAEKKTTDDKSEEKKEPKVVDIYKVRQRYAKIEAALGQQFGNNRLLACLSSSPGQVGRADGYLLEGKELEFYLKKIRSKKEK
jgi:small subunit ribosomal protein S8e